MNNKFNQVVALTVFTAFTHMSSAEDYTSEFSASYLTGDIDAEGQTSDVDQFGVSQQVFFSEVDTSVGPLGKAAFVSRASSYTVGYSVIDGVEDTDVTNAAIDWRGNDMGLTLGLDYSFTDMTSSAAISDEVVASVGFYVAETTEIALHYTQEKSKQVEVREKALALTISHVGTGDIGFAIEGSLSMTEIFLPEDNNNFFSSVEDVISNGEFGLAVSAALYPTPQFGMGAGFDVSLADDDNDSVFAFAEWFFKPNLKAAVTYSVSDQDNANTNAFILDVSFRL